MKRTRKKWTAVGLIVSLILIGAYIYLYTAHLDIELIPDPNLSRGVTNFYVYNGTKTIKYSIWNREIEKWLIEKINDAERDKYKLRQEIESLKEENQTLRSALADKQITSSGDSSKEDGDE